MNVPAYICWKKQKVSNGYIVEILRMVWLNLD